MSIRLLVIPPTTNRYSVLDDDEMDEYGDYTQPWKLDSAATSSFAGKKTGIRKRRKVKNGFKVGVVNGESMTQQEKGYVPFNVPPLAVSHVAVFDHMPNPLLGCGPLIKASCYINLDTPQAQVIDKKTGKVILTAEFEPWSATWDVFLTCNCPMMWQLPQAKTKKDIIGFYHKAACHPLKKTWLPAIKRGAYASWPGLTETMVQKSLDKQEATIMGHMHARIGRPEYQAKNKKTEDIPTISTSTWCTPG